MSDYLAHYGVLGMKWGVRNAETRARYSRDKNEFTKKEAPYSDKHMKGHMRFNSRNGDELELRRSKKSTLSRLLSQINPNVKKQIDSYSDFKVYSNGKRVGSLSLNQDDETTLNGVWLSVKEKHRGKGYGQAIVDNAIQYAVESGNKKFTLEVPGNSPDARHIYEKYGAVEVGTLSEDDIWDGLTSMEIDLTKKVSALK